MHGTIFDFLSIEDMYCASWWIEVLEMLLASKFLLPLYQDHEFDIVHFFAHLLYGVFPVFFVTFQV